MIIRSPYEQFHETLCARDRSETDQNLAHFDVHAGEVEDGLDRNVGYQ